MTPREITALRAHMTEAEREEFDALIAADVEDAIWRPLPGPQELAYASTADVIGYGGSAGGGKSELAIGKALMQHHEVLILRREATQLKGILRRLETLLGDRDGYNGQERTWKRAGPRAVTIEFGSCPNAGDETRHQGNPHDLLCVGRGTMVLTPAGQTAIERLLVGDEVLTMEGPRRVVRVLPVRRDAAYEVRTQFGSQIQSATHALLGYGEASDDPSGSGPTLCHFVSPNDGHFPRSIQLWRPSAPGSSLASGSEQSRTRFQGSVARDSGARTEPAAQGSGCAVSAGGSAVGDQESTRQAGDAGLPSPSSSPASGAARTPRYMHCPAGQSLRYVHPYTGEIRPVSQGVLLSASCDFSFVGEVDLYDIEVEGVNHYLTSGGFVNKNCFDEAANFLELQVNFLLGWNRSTREGVRSQALLTFNPPTSAEGRWIVDFFAPWIDRNHALFPTPPGEVRYCVTVPQENETVKYVWVPDARPCVIDRGTLVYDFDADAYTPEDIVTPQARTFIPSRISDNPYLANSGYLRVLQAMPEPLRSQMLYGDFQAGMSDDPWQVIPTAWVEAAQARWQPMAPRGEMLTMGVDVARGGKDNTVIAPKHRGPDGRGTWFDRLRLYLGTETPDGPMVAGLVIAARRDDAPILIDVIGVGASPYDVLKGAGQQVIGVNVSEAARGADKSGRLQFLNLRSELWWRMREALDPANDTGIALPPDKELLIELCTPTWSMSGTTIKVEGREGIYARIRRSVDRATAVVLANIDMPKRSRLGAGSHTAATRREHDPFASL